ncbi:hypothetical protein RSOLAG22IIIB_05523 [Rhizoctonia solani]|nr:hypothetical protein RSOLAG22IIIB_05523 [Rhizoctonia solani]
MVNTPVFDVQVDAYDPDYHWGGVSVYPEGPIPTEIQYPGLPPGMNLPPGIPIHPDFFVTPAPPHLAHIPFECPGAPRPDRKPTKPKASFEANTKPGLYGPIPRFPHSHPTFVYAYECEGERWAHLPEHLRPIEVNPKVQGLVLVLPEEETYEREVESVITLQVLPLRSASSPDLRVLDQSYPNMHLNKALRNFRSQFRESV